MKVTLQENNDNNDEISDKNVEKNNTKKPEIYALWWKYKSLPTKKFCFLGKDFSIHPYDINTWTPIQYFRWKHDISVQLAEKILYSMQRKVLLINRTSWESDQFI